MVEVNWDELAQDADTGIPGFLGKMKALVEEGNLRNFVAVYEYSDGKDGYKITYWTSGDTSYLSALGASEHLKDQLLRAGTWDTED